MDKRQELDFLKMLEQGGLNKRQELKVLQALEGDISGDQAMKSIYLESLKPSNSFEEMVDSKRVKSGPDSKMFDTETGITNNKLRRQLAGAETSGEEEKVLGRFGFREGDYVRDERGNLAITPKGALLLGIETDKPIMIDESGFSLSDLQDFVGAAGEEIVGGIGGAIAGQAAIPIPVLGAMIGAFAGAGGGKLFEEGVETLRGTQEEGVGEVLKDAAIEGAMAAAGEGIFAAVGKGFSAVAGRGRVGGRLSAKEAEDAAEAIQAGYLPSLSAIDANSIISRQQAITEKVLGSTDRLVNNNSRIMEDLASLRVLGSDGVVDVIRTADVLTNAVKAGDAAVANKSKKVSSDLLRHMDDIATQLGKAAVKDVEIDSAIQKSFSQAFKEFDTQARIQYENIDNLVSSATGDAKIFNTSAIVKDAQRELDQLVAAGGGNLGKVQNALQDIVNLGDNASFAQIYKARKSLNDTWMGNYGSDSVRFMKDKFLGQLDNRIQPRGLSAALRSNLGKTLDDTQKQAMKTASKELVPANKFFRAGMEQFEAVSQAASMKELAKAVKSGSKEANPSGKFGALIRDDNAQLLKDTKTALDKFAPNTYEPLRERAAGEWLRKTLNESGVGEGARKKFSGSKFKLKLDKLGSTADELFGKQAPEIRKLADQLDSLSLTNIDQSVIKGFADSGVDDAGITLLKKVKDAMDEQSVFKRTSVNAKLRSGILSADEAADLISSPAMRGPEVKKLKEFFNNDPAQMDNLKTYYMNNLIGDFEETFLTNKDSFKLLAKRFETAKKTGTLEELFGKEQAQDIFKFGRIMNVLGKSAQGGDLVAANIAANPFQNIGRIGRFFLLGKVLSNEAMYKSFAAKYGKEAAKAKTPTGKMQVFLDVMNQTVQSFAKQNAVRGAVEGVSTAKEESLNLVNDLQDVVNKPSRTSVQVPNVSPVNFKPYLPDMPAPQYNDVPAQPVSLRDRVKSNPALAATLLGGLGNAGLL
jgi:hypothetical protein